MVISRDKSNSIGEPSGSTLLGNLQISDEATLIEERRQKREAIKAKYRCLVATESDQTLISDGRSAASATADLPQAQRTDGSNIYLLFQICC